MATILRDEREVGEMEELKPWTVTYTYHDMNEVFHVETEVVMENSVFAAAETVDSKLEKLMEKECWSDYLITNVNLIREVH